MSEEMISKFGFDPETDTDALNKCFIEIFEEIANDAKITLKDFSEGTGSPKIKAIFGRHIADNDILDHMNFTVFSFAYLTNMAKSVLEIFDATRTMVNEIAIENLSTVMLDTVKQLNGSDAVIANVFSSQMSKLNETAIAGITDGSELKDDLNKYFKIRYCSTTFALERVGQTDYDYMMDETRGFIRVWRAISFDKIRDVYESDDFRSNEKYISSPAATSYPSQELLDRLVVAIARIVPRFYCGVNEFFNLHSDPKAALKAYSDARAARPSTAPAYPDWTPDVIANRTGSRLRGSIPKDIFDPTDPDGKIKRAAADQAKSNTSTATSTASTSSEPSFDIENYFKNMDEEQKKNFTIGAIIAAVPMVLAALGLGALASILGFVGLILSSVFMYKSTNHLGWAIGMAFIATILSSVVCSVLKGILSGLF